MLLLSYIISQSPLQQNQGFTRETLNKWDVNNAWENYKRMILFKNHFLTQCLLEMGCFEALLFGTPQSLFQKNDIF